MARKKRRVSRKAKICRTISTPAGNRCLCRIGKKTRFAKAASCER